MLSFFINLFKNAETRKRMLITLLVLFVFKLGASLTVPGINNIIIKLSSNSILGMMSLLGGGSIEQMSLLALGVGPYITASIIVELLGMDVIPAIAEMRKDGKKGRDKMNRLTKYISIVIGLVQGYFVVKTIDTSYGLIENPGFLSYMYIAIVFTAGSLFTLWLADQISVYGIGNGTSMIIFAGIIADLPNKLSYVYQTAKETNASTAWLYFALYILMYLLLVVAVVFVQSAERRIPIQISSNRALNKTKGRINHIPLKLNSASVIPVIFASAFIQAPLIISSWISQDAYTKLSSYIDFSKWWFLCIYALLIIGFGFFYTHLVIDTDKISQDLQKDGQYIPGVRPGRETKIYLNKVLNGISTLGLVLLAAIAILPYIVSSITGLAQSASLGGTGIIIAVGVAMETISTLETYLKTNKYAGVKR